MLTLQDQILRWIASEPASLGGVIFLVGLVYGFLGWRFYRVLLGVTLLALSWLGGSLIAAVIGMPPALPVASLALVALFLALRAPQIGTLISAGGIGLLYGWYLAEQCGFPGNWPLACAAIVGGIGVAFANVSRRTTPMLLTTAQAGLLMLTGAIGVTAEIFPTFSSTFRDWARAWPLIGPIMVGAGIMMSYTYQSNQQQGSMIGGQ